MDQLMKPENLAIALGVLFGISEALSLVPSIKANGIFQLVLNILKAILKKPEVK